MHLFHFSKRAFIFNEMIDYWRHWRTTLPVDKQLLIRTRKKFLPKKSCQIESGSVERTNLQLVLLTNIPVVSQPDNSGCVDRTSDVSKSYQVQGTETVASPHVPVASQPDSGCLDRTSAVSPLYRHLTSESLKGNCWHSPSSFGFK